MTYAWMFYDAWNDSDSLWYLKAGGAFQQPMDQALIEFRNGNGFMWFKSSQVFPVIGGAEHRRSAILSWMTGRRMSITI